MKVDIERAHLTGYGKPGNLSVGIERDHLTGYGKSGKL